ncbi:hypothetical protein [Brachybacterium vulturis]|uniref:hypothetical protein n=1 Tax=Brachybacterium vulturis TaxID=2017484 RepID=UPI003735A1DD
MRNRGGNDDHGPGGDPSWLGGEDGGGADSPGSGSWSSDFGSDDQRSGSDVGDSDSDFGGRRDPHAAGQMAPRFGDRAGDRPLPSGGDEDSPWSSAFTGQGSESSGSGRSTLSRLLGGVVPFLMIVIFGVIAVRVFGGSGGIGGFGPWWIFLFIGIPIVNRVIRAIRKHLGD